MAPAFTAGAVDVLQLPTTVATLRIRLTPHLPAIVAPAGAAPPPLQPVRLKAQKSVDGQDDEALAPPAARRQMFSPTEGEWLPELEVRAPLQELVEVERSALSPWAAFHAGATAMLTDQSLMSRP